MTDLAKLIINSNGAKWKEAPGTHYFTYKREDGKKMRISEWVDYYKKNPFEKNTQIPILNHSSVDKKNLDRNLIYFGAPGTGKSWALNENQKNCLTMIMLSE